MFAGFMKEKKVQQLFRLPRALVAELNRAAKVTGLRKNIIVERALEAAHAGLVRSMDRTDTAAIRASHAAEALGAFDRRGHDLDRDYHVTERAMAMPAAGGMRVFDCGLEAK